MQESKAHIISRLQKDILLLQGFKPATNDLTNSGLDLIGQAFPNSNFPTGAIHEFICDSLEDNSASTGFVCGIVSSLMKKGGVSVWISSSQNIFPPAMKSFGVSPEKIIFIQLKKETEQLWAMEETLKCDSVCSVVGEINEISFTQSRRFQLAVEQSKVTGFLLRRNPKNLSTTCVTRWKIKPIKSSKENHFPGLGFPGWNVELIKVRNGHPGSWQMEWRKGKFVLINQLELVAKEEQRKIV